jgi:hypothetical protein
VPAYVKTQRYHIHCRPRLPVAPTASAVYETLNLVIYGHWRICTVVTSPLKPSSSSQRIADVRARPDHFHRPHQTDRFLGSGNCFSGKFSPAGPGVSRSCFWPLETHLTPHENATAAISSHGQTPCCLSRVDHLFSNQ